MSNTPLIDKIGAGWVKVREHLIHKLICASGKPAIDVEIKDQIPLSKDNDVKVELLQSDNAEFDKEKAYLTWNVKISPSETKKIRVSYKVRYPKDYSISNLN